MLCFLHVGCVWSTLSRNWIHTQRPICSRKRLSWSCHPIETFTNVSSVSVLPSTPIGEHWDGERSMRGSCFWLHVVSSTEILLRQSFILKWSLVQVTNKELSTLWQYPSSRTTWISSFVLNERSSDNLIVPEKGNLRVTAVAQKLQGFSFCKGQLTLFISGKDKVVIFDEKRRELANYVVQVNLTPTFCGKQTIIHF